MRIIPEPTDIGDPRVDLRDDEERAESERQWWSPLHLETETVCDSWMRCVLAARAVAVGQ